jgi:integrase
MRPLERCNLSTGSFTSIVLHTRIWILPRFTHGAARMNTSLQGSGVFACWRFAPSACTVAGLSRTASFQTSVHCPYYHQRLKPYIFSATDVAKLLRAVAGLERKSVSPLRPEVIRLAIVLLFTTGIRRGELLGLNARRL